MPCNQKLFFLQSFKNKKENKTIIVAADSTGHGVPGAFMSMLGVTLLNEIIVKKKICMSRGTYDRSLFTNIYIHTHTLYI